MKRSRQLFAATLLFAILAFSAPISKAGIIVGFAKDTSEVEKCEATKDESLSAKFDRGIIVGLTGIIVGFTGIIVGFGDTTSECGHLPTGD